MGVERTVLLVEDDAIIAMELEDSLADMGWNVLGPSPSVEKAMQLIDDRNPDIALLDFSLKTETTEALARHLLSLSVPVVFLSGDTRSLDIEALKSCPVLTKPITIDIVHKALNQSLG